MQNEPKTSLVWFRNDLRTFDNSSLTKAKKSGKRIVAVYCFDPRHFQVGPFSFKKTEKFRVKFLLETIEVLKENLENLNITLFTYFDRPEHIIPQLVQKLSVHSIFLQKEWTSEETFVLEEVKRKTPSTIKFVESYDQFLYHPEDISFDIAKLPRVFTEFRKICENKNTVRKALPSPDKLDQENKISNDTVIPSLEDLGYETFDLHPQSAFSFQGGEIEGRNRLHSYLWKTKKLLTYKKTRNGLIGADYSSKLSAWLANGSLSPRSIYWEIKEFEHQVEKNESTYWLVFELIWRDFFKYVSLRHGNQIFKQQGILDRTYKWDDNADLIDQWINGKTKSSFVNANMIEIKKTGWMSNRGRQNVASYFAKELMLDWRIGASYFESMLLDYDVHSNYGNWMYVAGVGNDPRDRKFNVSLQAERYDPQGKFQQLWLQSSLFDF
ncbi:MAG: deoxyribodipyrimidine photolyase [Pseudozobellia sp.]|nr:deoxyribodipyrimidine photolyase [Pseudozobellia sp.]|tara:strand:- start:30139 stop:31455 length:1317 start_codon:yes stop_codon:yes gene_type:complete